MKISFIHSFILFNCLWLDVLTKKKSIEVRYFSLKSKVKKKTTSTLLLSNKHHHYFGRKNSKWQFVFLLIFGPDISVSERSREEARKKNYLLSFFVWLGFAFFSFAKWMTIFVHSHSTPVSQSVSHQWKECLCVT